MAELAAERYGPRLKQFLIRRLGCPEDAKDLSQEVHARLLEVDAKDVDDPGPYILKCANSVLSDHYSKPGPKLVSLEGSQELAESLHSESDSILDADAERDFVNAVKSLPTPKMRIVLIELVVNHLTTAEIAKKYDLKEETVKDYLSRAETHVRRHFSKGEHHE